MEDSTAKTIDFLRARLLAERSVSRTARQRANELAKGSADDDVSRNDDATTGHCEDEGITSSEGIQNSADVEMETSMDKLGIHEDKKAVLGATSCNEHSIKNHETERDMERALKHQAQFIAQYEEEEKAQKEWEDKFRENNGSPPDSCDLGTHSDVTEESDEIKAPNLIPEIQETLTFLTDAKLNEQPKMDMKSESSGIQNDLPEVEQTQENPDDIESVFEALQQAKLSLKQTLDKFSLLENGPSVPAYRSADKFPVPFSTVGLFRLPTDYEYGEKTTKTTTRANSLSYDSRLSLTNYPTDSSPYRESISRSVSSADDRFRMVPTFPYQEPVPDKVPLSALNPILGMGPSSFDPKFDMGMGPSAHGPRLGVRMGLFAHGPRLGVGPSAIDPRIGAGLSATDTRMGVTPSTLDQRLVVGSSAFDPRFETDPQFTGDRYTRSVGLPPYIIDMEVFQMVIYLLELARCMMIIPDLLTGKTA